MSKGPDSNWLDRMAIAYEPRRWSILYILFRVAIIPIMIVIIAATYFPMSLITADRSYDLATSLDRAIPFVPWTWWIYFPHYVLGVIITTVMIPDPRIIFRVMLAITIGQFLSITCYFILPSTYPRPTDVGNADPITTAALHWFWGVDPANNTFPSTHVANAFMTALGAWLANHRIRWYSLVSAIGVLITIHTTKQHYLVDAIGGLTVAYVSFRLALKVWPLPKDVSVMKTRFFGTR